MASKVVVKNTINGLGHRAEKSSGNFTNPVPESYLWSNALPAAYENDVLSEQL
jgi:hypothetical protein